VRTLPGAERDKDHAKVSMGLTLPVGEHAAVSMSS